MLFPGSDRTGSFWFFNDQNIEFLVKVLDGNDFNSSHWVFAGGLSDVEYWIEVVDRDSNERRIYYNPPGNFCGFGDIRAFPSLEDRKGALESASNENPALFLHQGRFRVDVEWHTASASGAGTAIQGTDESGFFWFFFGALSDVEYTVTVQDTTTGQKQVYKNEAGTLCGQRHIDAFE